MADDATRHTGRGNLEAQIDDNLRRIYDETRREEMPDRFHDLIAQLRRAHNESTRPWQS